MGRKKKGTSTEMLTFAEVARRLDITRSAVNKAVKRGRLVATVTEIKKVYRVSVQALEDYKVSKMKGGRPRKKDRAPKN